jgi:TAP-like protein
MRIVPGPERPSKPRGAPRRTRTTSLGVVRPGAKSPVLVIPATDDTVNPTACAHLLDERLPGAELHLFHGARHGHYVEQQPKATDAVHDFLARQPLGGRGLAALSVLTLTRPRREPDRLPRFALPARANAAALAPPCPGSETTRNATAAGGISAIADTFTTSQASLGTCDSTFHVTGQQTCF